MHSSALVCLIRYFLPLEHAHCSFDGNNTSLRSSRPLALGSEIEPWRHPGTAFTPACCLASGSLSDFGMYGMLMYA